MARTKKDDQVAATWAEEKMTLKPASKTALRGTDAAKHGREALERAMGGRPSIDPAALPGQHARKRQVRLPADVDRELTALAEEQQRSTSSILRDAVTDYLRSQRAS